jgi:hypothetical protein
MMAVALANPHTPVEGITIDALGPITVNTIESVP